MFFVTVFENAYETICKDLYFSSESVLVKTGTPSRINLSLKSYARSCSLLDMCASYADNDP